MKKLEFESNGSKWLLLCANNREYYYLNTRVIDNPNGIVGNGVSLCMITEEQASDVVDWNDEKQFYYKYPHTDWQGDISAIESLYSLIKSKGIHLHKNPYQDDWDELCIWGHGDFSKDGKSSFQLYKDAESKTFYNPILFKILS